MQYLPPFVASAPAPGQGQYAQPAPPPVTIPFDLLNGHIVIKAKVQGAEAYLILDTGSSASVVDSTWAAAVPLRSLDQQMQVHGAGSSTVTLKLADSIDLGPVSLHNVPVVLADLGDVSRMEGRPIDGTLGYDFFNRYVVEIDYQTRELRVHEPSSFKYRGAGAAIPVSLQYRIPIATVLLTPREGQPTPARLVLDLGSSVYSVRLSATFAEAHPDFLRAPSYTAPIGTGVGGMVMGAVTRLQRLQLGSLALDNRIVAIASEKKGALALGIFDGSIGSAVFERTIMTVDYPSRRIILEPRANLAAVDSSDASGLYLGTAGNAYERVLVRHVVDRSPASEAGVLVGDEITEIDGNAISRIPISELRQLFKRAGASHRLTAVRNGEAVELTIRLRPLI